MVAPNPYLFSLRLANPLRTSTCIGMSKCVLNVESLVAPSNGDDEDTFAIHAVNTAGVVGVPDTVILIVSSVTAIIL